MIAGWLTVGMAGGLSQFLAIRISGGTAAFPQAASGPLLASIIWIPLTFAALGLAAAVPPRSFWGIGLHLLLAAASSLALNALFQLASLLVPSGNPSWDRIVPDALVFLPMNAAAYLGILAAREWWLRRQPDRLGRPAMIDVKVGSKLSRIPVDEVAWIEARGDYVKLHTALGAHLASRRMSELEELLQPQGFVRIHRSAIVNPARVRLVEPRSHGDSQVTLDDGTSLRVSRQRRHELMAAIEAASATGAGRS